MRTISHLLLATVCPIVLVHCAGMDGEETEYGSVAISLNPADHCIEDPVDSGEYRLPIAISYVVVVLSPAGDPGSQVSRVVSNADLVTACNSATPTATLTTFPPLRAGSWDGVLEVFDQDNVLQNDLTSSEAWLPAGNTSSRITGIPVRPGSPVPVRFRAQRGRGIVTADVGWDPADFDN